MDCRSWARPTASGVEALGMLISPLDFATSDAQNLDVPYEKKKNDGFPFASSMVRIRCVPKEVPRELQLHTNHALW